jgi:hypothetical protein
MHGIEFIVRVVSRNLLIVVGHFVVAGMGVLGLLLLDHLLEELLGLLLLLCLSSLLCRLLCRIITILDIFIP